MSRMSRSNQPARSAPVAGLARTAEGWALVVLSPGSPARVSLARTFGAGREGEIVAALSAAGVGRLVRTAPAARTIARCAEIPSGQPEEMNAAAEILAEGSLPEDIPPYRRAAAVLMRAGEGNPAALLTAWRNGRAEGDDVSWDDQRFTTEIAALAALSRGKGLAVRADRVGRAISILASGPSRIVARVLVEGGEEAAWREAIARHVRETCRSAGVQEPADAGAEFTLSTGIGSQFSGAQGDRQWLETYGIALGAAALALHPEASLRRLAELLPDAPAEREPALERFVAWISRPSRAWAVSAACIGAMLLAPLGLAAARLAVLDAKTKGMPDQDLVRAEVEQKAAMYRELDQIRWPMTKLWADISAATPVGVSVEGVRLAPEQGLSVQGTADSLELLEELQKNLNETGVLNKLKIVRSESTASGVSFDLSAEVVSPHTAVKPAQDFAAKPLAVRLYGEGASNTTYSSSSAGGSRSGDNGSRADRSRDRERPARESAPSARPDRPLDIPAALTDAQIQAMDATAAMTEWAKRRAAASKAGNDQALKTRLEAEADKLKARMQAARGGGGNK